MTARNITQSRLHELLNYDVHTGYFKWRIKRTGQSPAGTIAGSIDSKGYIRIGLDGTNYLASRLAWLYCCGRFPDCIDHINRNRLDNRMSNLRSVDKSINGKNRSKSIRNTSGVTGVYWYPRDGKWQAKITVNGKAKHLGLFNCTTAASIARKSVELKSGFTANHGV